MTGFDFSAELALLDALALLRRRRTVERRQGAWVQVDGREVLCCCSNDYLGLADDPRLLEAAAAALREWGLGSTGSRLTTGDTTPHRRLEVALADWMGTEAALVFPTGYQCNVGVISVMARDGDLILSDALNHASLIDGCRLSRATVRVYRHADAAHAAELLSRERASFRNCLVITDGVFSMDSDVAPVAELLKLCERFDATLVVDDAHGVGVFGEQGAGVTEGLPGERLIRIGTLSKALGGEGGFVAAGHEAIEYLVNRSRSFIFSTGVSPVLAAAATRAVGIVRSEPARRQRLLSLATELRAALAGAGVTVPPGQGPIVPVVLGSPQQAAIASAALLERGFWVMPIRPPTVPEGTSRLRICVSFHHTEAQLRALADAVAGVTQP